MGVGQACFFLLGFWCGIFVRDMDKAIEKRRLLVQHGSGRLWEFLFYTLCHIGGTFRLILDLTLAVLLYRLSVFCHQDAAR